VPAPDIGDAPNAGADRHDRPVAGHPANLAPCQQWRTSYSSDGRELAGCWLVPAGAGPFPAVVFNHGSGGLLPLSMPGVRALPELGYAAFLAIRRGHNGQPGTFWEDRVTAAWGGPEMNEQLMAALLDELRDVRAAVGWVVDRPEVDRERVALVGSSYGGVLIVLAAAEPGRCGSGELRRPVDDLAGRAGAAAGDAGRGRRRHHPALPGPGRRRQQPAADLRDRRRAGRQNRPHEVRVYPEAGTACSARTCGGPTSRRS
jgi:dienelactone hydrolase